MAQICWICHQKCDQKNKCKCHNDFSICHNSCLMEWYKVSGNDKCRFCNTTYQIPYTLYYYHAFIKFLKEIEFFFKLICEYNLYTGLRWDDEDD